MECAPRRRCRTLSQEAVKVQVHGILIYVLFLTVIFFSLSLCFSTWIKW